ncbi:hypothetical protein MTO96_042890 [Rhipicephalus appendiculatus]
MAYTVSGMDLPATEFNPEEWSVVLNARTRSPHQQSKETEGTQSPKAASADGTQASKTESAPSVPSKVDDTAVARLRLKRLPRLPVDDFKIVFRPSAGVNLAQYNDGELRAAVVANSGLHSAVAEEDLVCTNLPKNIFTVSTSCADRVANYAKIRELTLRGNKLAFHAYIAPPDGARPGIIYRAWNGESPQDLLRELRRANPLLPIVQARDMGRTSRSVLIHFMAEELPPSVKMFGILYAVFNFRPKVEACLNCRQVGHRRDVCPLPNRLTCSSCGQKHPEDQPCTPQCVICGDAHMTGDRACKQRFQRGSSRPSRPRQRPQQEQQQQQHEFRLEKESFPSIHDGNRGNRSKSPGRNHGSKGKSPGRSASQSRDLGTQSGKVSWVGQTSCSCGMRSDPNETSKTQETIERLIRENQELKQQLALVLDRLSSLAAVPPASSPPLSISPSITEPDMADLSGTDLTDSSPHPAKKEKNGTARIIGR